MTRERLSIQEQLTPFVTRPVQAPTIKLVNQVVADIRPKANEDCFSEAQRQALRWLSNRAGIQLPPSAWKGESFDLSHTVGAMPTEVIKLDDNLWAMKHELQDTSVPRRVWMTEIQLAQLNSRVSVGIRLTCISRGTQAPYEKTIPGIVKQLNESLGLSVDDLSVSDKAWLIRTEDEVDKLIALVESQKRWLPVIIVSLVPNPSNKLQPHQLAKRCLGLAHVILLSPTLSKTLTDRWGRNMALPEGGVRTYAPKFDESDEFFKHPFITREGIENWDEHLRGNFMTMLVEKAMEESARYEHAFRRMPRFTQLKQRSLEITRERFQNEIIFSGEDTSELNRQIKLLQQEIEEHSQEAKDWQTMAYDEEKKAKELEESAATVKAESLHLRHRISILESQLKDSQVSRTEEPLPDTLEDIIDWADRNLIGKLYLHNRARRGLKKGVFQDVEKVGNALLLLANQYRDMILKGQGLEDFEKGLQKLGLDKSKSMESSKYGEYQHEYEISYEGRKLLLEHHLKAGNSKDERFCLRIYFNWDEETQQVIVGWLPSHLTTSQT